jgi:hypothetical protein
MGTLRIFVRRVFWSALDWAVLLGLVCLLSLAFVPLASWLPKAWLPAGVAILPFALFLALRLGSLWPPLAGWLAFRLLVRPSGLFEPPALPDRAEVVPNPSPNLRSPGAVRQLVERLVERGFVDVGTFDFRMTETVPLVLLAHPAESAWANAFEAEHGRLVVEYVTRYADGRRVGYSNDRDRGFATMPGRRMVRETGAAPLAVWDRFLAERPAGDFVPVRPETTLAVFKQDTDEYLAWRKQHGFTPRERGMLAAPLMTAGLTILTLGTGYLTLLAVLVSTGMLVLGEDRPLLTLGVLLPLLFAAVLAPFFMLGLLMRRFGVCPPLSQRCAPAAADIAPPDAPFQLTPSPDLDRWLGEQGTDRPLRELGFQRVGAFVSPLGALSLSVRPADGSYAVNWWPELGGSLEVVVAGADGSHHRATPLSGPDAEGRVTIDRALGPAELEARCRAQAGGLERAVLTAETVPAVLEQHLAGDNTWRLEVASAAPVVEAEYRQAHRFTWRRLLGELWWLSLPLLAGLMRLLEWAGVLDEDAFLSSGRVFGVWLLVLVGGYAVWPWLKEQFRAARKEAAEHAGRT